MVGVTINALPTITSPRNEPLQTLDVTFSEAISAATFTSDDLTLTRDGQAVALTGVTITPLGATNTTFRIAGLEATATASAASVSWTPSPEKGVAAYLVTWGTAENPGTQNVRVLQPKVTLPGVKAGAVVRVKAVNAKGMEGWDWARAVVK